MLDIFQKVNKQKNEKLNQKKIKAGSVPRKQKNISQNSKKFLKNVEVSGFAILK